MTDDEDSMQLSEYCFDVCKELKAAIQGRDVDSLDESVRVALEDLGRWANQPHPICSPTKQL